MISLVLALALAATAPHAANPWLPWTGCWARASDGEPPVGAEPRRVCIVPRSDTMAEIVTVAHGAVIAADTLLLSNGRRDVDAQGCTGWESVAASADGSRLYRSADLTCQGGPEQVASQLFAIDKNGGWIDVQAVTIAGRTGSRMLRYESVPADGIPAELAAIINDAADASGRARIAASGAPDADAVVEASGQVSGTVVATWLARTGRGFPVSGSLLQSMAARGVSGEAIDVAVAQAYPQVFAVRSSSRGIPSNKPAIAFAGGPIMTAEDRYLDCITWSGRGSFGACRYLNGYDPYFLQDFWYLGAPPIQIVTPAGSNGFNASTQASPHGHVSKDDGYHPGPGAPAGSVTGQPRDMGSGSVMTPNGPSGSSGAGTGSASTGGTAGSTPSGDRTAHPRPQ